jgi:hypothetical protein
VAAISRAEETVFRTTANGRVPIASASDRHNHVFFNEPRRSEGIGCITSRTPGQSATELIMQSRLRRKGLEK